jgi:hypothetical protein
VDGVAVMDEDADEPAKDLAGVDGADDMIMNEVFSLIYRLSSVELSWAESSPVQSSRLVDWLTHVYAMVLVIDREGQSVR